VGERPPSSGEIERIQRGLSPQPSPAERLRAERDDLRAVVEGLMEAGSAVVADAAVDVMVKRGELPDNHFEDTPLGHFAAALKQAKEALGGDHD
jgi:hypothetical protein